MKKLSLLLTLCVVFEFSSVKAQDFNKYRFGLQASPLIGWIKPDVQDYEMNGIKMGFNWGGMAEYYFAKNYAIKTGFSITNTGGKLKYRDTWLNKAGILRNDGVLYRNYSTKYLEIPLGIKFKTNEIGYLTYFGHIGISTGFRTSSKSEDKYEYIVPPNVTVTESWEKQDMKDNVSFWRESLLIGLGVEFGITKSTSLVSSLTYNNGFSDILTKNNHLSGKAHRGFSNYIELSIGIMF